MKPINIKKMTIDSAMPIGLLLLMGYGLVGQVIHEWIGVGMFILFIWHHILNSNWSKSLFRGRYNAYRLAQTALVSAMRLCTVGLMVSGIVLSRHVFSFLPINGGRQLARTIHLLCSYLGVCSYECASRLSLEQNDGDDAQTQEERIFGFCKASSQSDGSIRCIWCLRLYFPGNRDLYAIAEPIRIL